MPAITMPARQCGKTVADAMFSVHLQMRLLSALFEANRAMSLTELETQLRCTRRDLWQAIRAQANLANIKRGQPIELTTSGHIAVAAGRYAGAMAVAA